MILVIGSANLLAGVIREAFEKARGAGAPCTQALSLKKGAKRPSYRHGILGARTRTSQLASPPGGTWQCIPWRPSARDRETPLECGAPS